ncbi:MULTISPECIES: PH domain-containing protein [Flavobacterium]|uniref:PH domain-containing protein n=1 Tax=Flavobacterium jumunjinense TaxID=998845 RepID=A0ABV5GLW9_9FLAO|nr:MULTISPECIES: PH domain-containing protein [Flavobacterium]
MNNFTNETIDISSLPKFEEVKLHALHSKYFKIILINICIVFGILFLGFFTLSYLDEEVFSNRVWMILGISLTLFFSFVIVFNHLSFKKRGYAFREHDVIYKSGLINEKTVVIPNNRVQHVALHQGFFSRMFGLAAIELFTAGGGSSDLEIPGLLLEEAQKIKNSISLKINDSVNELENVEEENRIDENHIKEKGNTIVEENNEN